MDSRRGTPGLRYGLERLRNILRPPVTVTPPPKGVRFEHDVPVKTRDGTTLRVNVFRPDVARGTEAPDRRYPVIMCAHPYGKDQLPRRTPFGYLPPMTYRMMRQPAPVRFSAWTTWEAPDPAFWVPRGYALVNVDLRGFGHSDGVGSVLSDQEAQDYADVVEWAAAQPWSTGRVGLNGVSYLALSQWKVAALHPPHLAAICPWEGFSDVYRDLAYPGGVREDGFVPFWSAQLRRGGRPAEDLRHEQLERPLWDDWWATRVPCLEEIQVPALICASFSDHNLHSRGCFEAFRRIGSRHRWLYTHRGGKWATYYSPEALAFQARFFDHFLKGEENGILDVPPVRLEVRDTGDSIHEVREEAAWPLPGTRWTPLTLRPDGYLDEALPEDDGDVGANPPRASGIVSFDALTGRASFSWTASRDVEVTGPMRLRLYVSVLAQEDGADSDTHLFVAVRKLRGNRYVGFEGSYGFGLDVVTRGLLNLSHRLPDEERSTPWQPVSRHDVAEPLAPGEIAAVDVELLPSSTFFRAGDVLRLDVQGHPLFRRNLLLGQFPADYAPSARGTISLHLGGRHEARLLVPIIQV